MTNNNLKRYNKLIAYYQQNPPTTGYCEVHHILPKSLGGSDEPSNFVHLPVKAHLIAHELYFKAHRHYPLDSIEYRQTARAYRAMCYMNNPATNKRERASNRQLAEAREAMSKMSKGLNNPAADTKLYTFYHEDGRQVTSTRYDFYTKYNLNKNNLSTIINQGRGSVKGWRLTKKKQRSRCASSTLHTFKHTSGLIITSTAVDFYTDKQYNVTPTGVNRLISGKQLMHQGWRLVQATPEV